MVINRFVGNFIDNKYMERTINIFLSMNFTYKFKYFCTTTNRDINNDEKYIVPCICLCCATIIPALMSKVLVEGMYYLAGCF